MSSTSTTRLGLFKPTPGSAEPFRTSDVNSNMDKIDAEAVAADGRLDVLETKVGAGGTVVNATNATTATTATTATSATSATTATTATKATNIAGGVSGNLPIQTAANTTAFISNSGTNYQVLTALPYPPYAQWATPVPFKMAAGVVLAADFTSGVSSTVDLSSYGFTSAPVVVLTPVYTGMNTLYLASISSTPNTSGFVVRQRLLTSGSSTVAAPATAVNVHWTAIQLVP
jgi:hypothetical protein